MKNSDITYENVVLRVRNYVSKDCPSSLIDKVYLVLFGMFKNYGIQYIDDFIKILNSLSFVLTDNKRDIYVKDVKNIKKYNYVNLFYEPISKKYAIYIDYRLSEIAILENLVLCFNELFTMSTQDIVIKDLINGIQSNHIMRYILDYMNISDSKHYAVIHHIGDTLFENLYEKEDIKVLFDNAIINNNLELLRYEFDSVLGYGSYHIIINLYESIQRLLSNNSDAYEIAVMYSNLRKILNKYMYLKSI